MFLIDLSLEETLFAMPIADLKYNWARTSIRAGIGSGPVC
jgi:hypothetical protein